MVKKKTAGKKGSARKKKSASKRTPARPTKGKRGSKPVRKRKIAAAKKPRGKRSPARGAKTKPGKTAARKWPLPAQRRVRRDAGLDVVEPLQERGLGLEAGGQSGDTEGLSREELADSESVEELVEEGQAFEAGVISGVENAPDADRGPVRTRQVPEDDVPREYLDQDRD
jgi:hypothetical protein